MEMNMNLVTMGNEMFEGMSLEEMNVYSQQLTNIRMEKITKSIMIQGKEIQLLKKQNEEQTIKIEELEENEKELSDKIEGLYDSTYVLATDDGKRRELTKKVNALTYKVTNGKNSIMDRLFHQSIIRACYKYIFDMFQVTTYSRIKISDYDEAMKSIGHWFMNKQNIKKCIGKRLDQYMKDLDKGILPDAKEKLLDKYLDKTNNGLEIIE